MTRKLVVFPKAVRSMYYGYPICV